MRNSNRTSAADSDDADLLRAIALGDRTAFERLYLIYYQRMLQFIRCRTDERDVIEGAIADTFVIVWQTAGRFRDAFRVSTWLYGIALHVDLKSRRRGARHMSEQPAVDAIEPRDAAGNYERNEWVAKGLRQLIAEQRTIVELAYRFGQSIEEIAAITRSPIDTVKARMLHARQRMRHCLPTPGGAMSSSPQKADNSGHVMPRNLD